MKNIIIKNKVSSPVKASFWFMVANFLQQGINIITIPIFTRILSEADYGIISVFSAWSALLSVIVTLSLSGGVYNNGLLDFSDDSDGFTSSMLGLSSVTTALFFVVYLVFSKQIQNIINLPSLLIIIMFLGFLLNPAMGFWMAKQRFDYKYKLCIILTLFTSILSPILSYIAVINYINDKSSAKIIAGSIVILFVNTIIYIYIFAKGKKFFNLHYWKYALIFNLPLVPHYLSTLALNQVDRIMISTICGNDKAGIYTIAYSAASIVNIIWAAINASWIPWTLKKMKERKYSDIGKMANPILLVCVTACIGLISFAPEAIKILAPPSYYEAIYVVPPVVVGMYFTFVYTLFGNVEFYHKKTLFIMIASVSAATLNIGLNFIFIHIFGYIAAAYTTLVGYMALCGIHYFFMRKIEKNKIYDIRFIILISGGLMAISIVMMFFYKFMIIRYSIITIMGIVVIIHKQSVFNIFKGIRRS